MFDPRPVHMRFVVDIVARGQIFLPVLLFSPVGVLPPMLHNYHLHVSLARRTNERNLGTPQKSNALSEIGKHWTFTFFFACRSDIWTPLWCTAALGCFSLHRPVTTSPLIVCTLTSNKLRCYCICCSMQYLVTPDVHCVTWVHGWSSKRIFEQNSLSASSQNNQQ